MEDRLGNHVSNLGRAPHFDAPFTQLGVGQAFGGLLAPSIYEEITPIPLFDWSTRLKRLERIEAPPQIRVTISWSEDFKFKTSEGGGPGPRARGGPGGRARESIQGVKILIFLSFVEGWDLLVRCRRAQVTRQDELKRCRRVHVTRAAGLMERFATLAFELAGSDAFAAPAAVAFARVALRGPEERMRSAVLCAHVASLALITRQNALAVLAVQGDGSVDAWWRHFATSAACEIASFSLGRRVSPPLALATTRSPGTRASYFPLKNIPTRAR